jgi:hypothetical protein
VHPFDASEVARRDVHAMPDLWMREHHAYLALMMDLARTGHDRFDVVHNNSLHHLPVVRQAVIASSFGLRFQGQGFFLTDARTHRGTSGAPVVMRAPASDTPEGDLRWKLLGVHSARMDMRTRDRQEDESLGLNCAWYADILMTLTEEADRPAVAGSLATLRDQDQADAKDQRVSSD